MYFIATYIIVLHLDKLDSTVVLYLEMTLSSEIKHQVKHNNEQPFERRPFPAQKLKQKKSHTILFDNRWLKVSLLCTNVNNQEPSQVVIWNCIVAIKSHKIYECQCQLHIHSLIHSSFIFPNEVVWVLSLNGNQSLHELIDEVYGHRLTCYILREDTDFKTN